MVGLQTPHIAMGHSPLAAMMDAHARLRNVSADLCLFLLRFPDSDDGGVHTYCRPRLSLRVYARIHTLVPSSKYVFESAERAVAQSPLLTHHLAGVVRCGTGTVRYVRCGGMSGSQ